MSELRGQPESPDASGADRPRPDPAADLGRVESLYDPMDHAPARRDSPVVEAQTFERPGLAALRDRIKQSIADRFGSGPDAPQESNEIQRPSFTKDYYTDLPRAAYDRCLVRDQDNPVPLFDGPPRRADVRQGSVGDCGIIATLGAVAAHRPDAIRNAIRQVGDGTYEVTLHKVYPAQWSYPRATPTGETTTLRLNDELPVDLDEAGEPPAAARPETCAWPALMEKALAGQDTSWGPARDAVWGSKWANESRQAVDKDRMGDGLDPAPVDAPTGYDRLNIGSTPHMRADLLAELTGEVAEVRHIPGEYRSEQAVLDEFRDLLADGKPILVGSRSETTKGELVPFEHFSFAHVYEVTKIEDGKIHLRNPWGDDRSPKAIDVQTLWEYFRRYNTDGSRDGEYTTLK